MRYDTEIYLQTITPGAYDPVTGDYADDTVEETEKYATVMDTRTETLRLLFGEIRQGCLTVSIQGHLSERPSRIRIGSKVYSVEWSRRLRHKEAFVIQEVQS